LASAYTVARRGWAVTLTIGCCVRRYAPPQSRDVRLEENRAIDILCGIGIIPLWHSSPMPQKVMQTSESMGSISTKPKLCGPTQTGLSLSLDSRTRSGMALLLVLAIGYGAPFTRTGEKISESFQWGGHASMKKTSTITAEEFDQRFDRGDDIAAFIDKSTIMRPGVEVRRVNVDFPEWIIRNLDVESKMIGVSRQSLIKLWVSERLLQERKARA
jgi:hypothetical protein